MNIRFSRTWLTLLIFVLFLAGCAPANAAPTAAPTVELEPAGDNGVVPETAGAAATATEAATATPPEPTATAAAAPADPGGGADYDPYESYAAPEETGGLRFEVISGESEARYRVREQLANVSLPNDAVGMTRELSGSVTIHPDGAIAEGSEFVVNMASLQTDSSRRDNYVRGNVLHTAAYPEAVFVPRRLAGLTFPLPESGEVRFEMTGDLTIRDVTREVTWQVEGTIDGPQAAGLATTSFTFADFNLTKPTVGSVLSIEDDIRLEIDIAIRAVDGG